MQVDKEILIRIKEGSRSAFGELLDECQAILFRFVFSLVRNNDDASDIVQETFIKVWKNINRFDINKNFTPWLYKIANNQCRDYWRRNTNLIKRNEDLKQEESASQHSDETPEINLLQHLDILPKKQKMIFILRNLQELSIADIASILSMTQSSVKTNLFYARRTLHEHLIKINKVTQNEL